MSDQNDGERRAVQRDWLGHSVWGTLQIAATLGGLGIPLLIWGTSVNTTIATMANTITHQEKDIADLRQVQALTTSQIIDGNKVLTRIETQLENIREQNKSRR